ncbi:TUBGCP2 family protein [Megaselia abdita]
MNDKNREVIVLALEKINEFCNGNLDAEEIYEEFSSSNKSSNEKLLNILKILSNNQINQHEILQEAMMSLEKTTPQQCLLKFLRRIDKNMGSHNYQFSTPNSNSTRIYDFSTPEILENLKEKIHAVASTSICRSQQNCSISNQLNISNPLTPSSSPSLFSFQKNRRKDAAQWFNLDIKEVDTQINIVAVPISTQEMILLNDIIFSLLGIRGTYIIPEEIKTSIGILEISFKVSDQIQKSLRDVTHEILPLGCYYYNIQNFIENVRFINCGQVLESLTATLRDLLHDYCLLISQLEFQHISGMLTVHKLHFYLRPTIKTMETLHKVINDITANSLTGGQILTLLYDKVNYLSGDEQTQKFITELLKRASLPYMNILYLWITKGIIDDPQNEFLIEDNEIKSRDETPENYSTDYWEKRYTPRRERIPRFLEKCSDVILRTGKYLNVIRQCGKKIDSGNLDRFHLFCPTSQMYMNIILEAYEFASKILLDVVLKENDLMGHLISIKKYLLLYQGDFITQLMDACEEELIKNVDTILPVKLENLLGLTLRLSSAKNDPYKDNLHCDILPVNLVTQMGKITHKLDECWSPENKIELTGIECFILKFDVKWPVSLVLNQFAISKYQMLFRQLFYCKHVERQLCIIWKENTTAKKFSPHTANLYRGAFTLSQRMMNAIQNLEYYMMIEVIEPFWHDFITKIKNKIENVDAVLIAHSNFLDNCLRNCFISDAVLLLGVTQLCQICLKFCEFLQVPIRPVGKGQLKQNVFYGLYDS